MSTDPHANRLIQVAATAGLAALLVLGCSGEDGHPNRPLFGEDPTSHLTPDARQFGCGKFSVYAMANDGKVVLGVIVVDKNGLFDGKPHTYAVAKEGSATTAYVEITEWDKKPVVHCNDYSNDAKQLQTWVAVAGTVTAKLVKPRGKNGRTYEISVELSDAVFKNEKTGMRVRLDSYKWPRVMVGHLPG